MSLQLHVKARRKRLSRYDYQIGKFQLIVGPSDDAEKPERHARLTRVNESGDNADYGAHFAKYVQNEYYTRYLRVLCIAALIWSGSLISILFHSRYHAHAE